MSSVALAAGPRGRCVETGCEVNGHNSKKIALLTCWTAAVLGCSGGGTTCLALGTDGACISPPGDSSDPLVSSPSLSDLDLAPGSQGAEVRAVQDYLAAYGYFENPELAARYVSWRPVVSEAPEPGVYDSPTASAVLEFQRHQGLEVTGTVNAATRAEMSLTRCGVPEGLAEAACRTPRPCIGDCPP